MSKKLIAVASAAALALSALVAVPAQATFAAPTITDAGTGTGAVATSPLLNGPNVLNTIVNNADGDGQATNTAVRFDYSGLTNGKVIQLSTTSSTIKFLPRSTAEALTGETINAASGTQTLDVAVAAGAAKFYVYNTSTTVGTFSVSYDGNTTVYHIRAIQGAPYNISVKFPAALGAAQTGDIDVTVTDRAGNAIEGTSNGVGFTADNNNSGGLTLTTAVVGAASFVTSATAYSWNTVRKVWVGKITAGADGGNVALTVTLNAASLAAVGFAAPVASAFGSIIAQDLAGLTTQVATLQAQLAASRPKATSVTKKRYNTLARKWNRANPSDRVALKK